MDNPIFRYKLTLIDTWSAISVFRYALKIGVGGHKAQHTLGRGVPQNVFMVTSGKKGVPFSTISKLKYLCFPRLDRQGACHRVAHAGTQLGADPVTDSPLKILKRNHQKHSG